VIDADAGTLENDNASVCCSFLYSASIMLKPSGDGERRFGSCEVVRGKAVLLTWCLYDGHLSPNVTAAGAVGWAWSEPVLRHAGTWPLRVGSLCTEHHEFVQAQ